MTYNGWCTIKPNQSKLNQSTSRCENLLTNTVKKLIKGREFVTEFWENLIIFLLCQCRVRYFSDIDLYYYRLIIIDLL